jgi:hypothetical protein
MRSQLANLQGKSNMSDDEKFIEYAKAFNDRIALVVTFEQMSALSNKEHETCMCIGTKLYGGKR